jgi:hypothetical protein
MNENAGFVKELTNEPPGGHRSRLPSLPRTLFAALVLTVAGVILVWVFMFLVAHG